MNQANKLKCAVVGCGNATKNSHLPILKKIDEVEVIALCDQDVKAAESLAQAFRIPKVYGDFSLMLDHEKLDFISICSPTQTHFELAMQAIKKKIHVLMEKPVTINAAEAKKLLVSAKENNIKFCVIHNNLYSSIAKKAISLIASGEIGDVLAVDVRISEKNTGPISVPEHWSNKMPGGRLADISVHAIYLIIGFLGKVKGVKAIARKHADFPWIKYDELKVLLEAERGLGSFYVSCNSPAYSQTMEIKGTKKSLFLNNLFMTIITHEPARSRMLRDLAGEYLSLAAQLIGKSISGIFYGKLGRRWYNDGHTHLIKNFVKCIIDDIDPPMKAEDSVECLRVIEEVWSQIRA